MKYSDVSMISFRGGGGQNIFGKMWIFAWREAPCSAWQSQAFIRGVWGHGLPRKFLRMMQFGAFWRIFC